MPFPLYSGNGFKRYIPRAGNENLYMLEDSIYDKIKEVIDYRVKTYNEDREVSKILTLITIVEAYGEQYRVGGNLLLESLVRVDFGASIAVLKAVNKDI